MSEQIRKLGNYILLDKIAVGGMAEVYLAKTLTSDKFLAIKKILPDYSHNLDFLNLFKEEVRVSLNLSHGNIVTFLDFITEKNQLYLVMEFVNGINLRQLVRDLKQAKIKMSLAHTLFIISEIAGGLDYAHRSIDIVTRKELNIIHRDVNPLNIMISFDGGIKIIDFGIARADSRMDVTKIGTLKGKFSYMSPEQIDGKPIDARTDIFALGIIFWELLTNERLFKGTNDFAILEKIKKEVIPPIRSINQGIPAELELIVMKALQKDPENRYQRASDLKFAIDQYIHNSIPNFRKVSFSTFISQIYQQTISSRTDKLVKFSKVKLDTEPSQSSAKIFVDRRSEKSGSKVLPELPEGFESPTVPKISDSFNFDVLKSENPFAAEVKTFTKQKAANFFTNGEKVVDETESSSAGFYLSNFKHLFLLIAVIYAMHSFYKEYINFSPDDKLAIATTPAISSDVSSDVSVAVNETSRKLASRSDDFSTSVYKKLKASSQLAYANIYVLNSLGKDVRIFVNGKELIEKSPIRRFPIYANEVTKITAYSSKMNGADEQKISVEPGKIVDVKLTLRPYKRH